MTHRTLRSRPGPRRAPLAVLVVTAFAGAVVGACSDVGSGSDSSKAASPATSTAPTDAAAQAFCGAYGLVRGVDADADAGDLAVQLRTHAVTLAGVGTPSDIPDAAREGFVVYVDAAGYATSEAAKSMVGAASAAELATALGVSPDDTPLIGAFQDYVAGTCFTAGP